MATIAALALVGAVINLVARDAILDATLKNAARGGDLPANAESAARTGATIGMVLGILFALVVVAGLLSLAVFNLRGNNVARIITWVVCGLYLFCGLLGLVGALSAFEYYPDWLKGWLLGSSVVSTLLYIAIIVLLALPASNAFFKPRSQAQF